jgi:hypothetical protein
MDSPSGRCTASAQVVRNPLHSPVELAGQPSVVDDAITVASSWTFASVGTADAALVPEFRFPE